MHNETSFPADLLGFCAARRADLRSDDEIVAQLLADSGIARRTGPEFGFDGSRDARRMQGVRRAA